MSNQIPAGLAPPWANGPYSSKRDGVTITNCDAEPIQTPGCVQSHGALLVLRPNDLTILQASENSAAWFGQAPDQLLGRSVAAVLGDEKTARLREVIEREPVERNPLHVFALAESNGGGRVDAAVHTLDGMAVLEFEDTGRDAGLPEPDYYGLIKKSVTRLQAADNLRDFGQKVTEEVQALTGLDRVMVYRFHADAHGEVFAESRRPDLPSWLGLHYPADDIPKPVREIFKKIWIRPLPDARAPLMELVPLANPDTGLPLDMTYCALRGASVMYTEYLHNMGVAASLTLPIRRDGDLWGLIACHHCTPTRFPYRVRAACEFLARVVSLQIKPVEDREHSAYRLRLESIHNRLLAAAARGEDLASLVTGTPNLLDALDAGGAALCHGGRWWRIGRTPTESQLENLADWLYRRPEFEPPVRPIYVTDSLIRDYPEGESFADVASGVIAVPLSRNHRSLMLWFRPETIQTVHWAGNPHDKPIVPGPNGPRLTPRVSFELFVESVRRRSPPWLEVEIEAALRLRIMVMELVVGRADRLAELNAALARSNEELDAFAYVASHDLKEPLRGISKYAYQLLENASSLDEESRKRVAGLMSLALRMDSLLDSLLHYSRVGRTTLAVKPVDLNEVVDEALEMVAARRAEMNADIIIARPLPTVCCDRMRVREVYVNLLSNALKYNDKPRRRIEIGYLAPHEAGDRPDAPPGADGRIILFVRDNGIGIGPRHHGQVFRMFKRLHGRDQYGGGTGAGLAIVRRLVERHHGRIWLDSTPGQGSTFYFTLSCHEDGPS